jgi:hypothetical protein
VSPITAASFETLSRALSILLTSCSGHQVQSLELSGTPVGIAYLFCDYQQQHSQETFLGCLLKQLAGYSRTLPTQLNDLYEKHVCRGTDTEQLSFYHADMPMQTKHNTTPSVKELQIALCEIVNSFERSFIVVDALDECQEEGGARDYLLSMLDMLQRKTEASILATSRSDIPEIEARFQSVLRLYIQAPDSDIDAFLDDQIPRFLPMLSHRPARIELDSDIYQQNAPTSASPGVDVTALGIACATEFARNRPKEGVAVREAPRNSMYNQDLHEEIKVTIRRVAGGT